MTPSTTCSSLANRLSSWCRWRGAIRQESACTILRALYRGSVARSRRWLDSYWIRLPKSSRPFPARCTTWKGSMTTLTSGSASNAALLKAVNPSIATMTPPIPTSDTPSQHRTVWLSALASHLDPLAIQARKRGQIRSIKVSISLVEVFQMDDVGISFIKRPRRLHTQRRQ